MFTFLAIEIEMFIMSKNREVLILKFVRVKYQDGPRESKRPAGDAGE
jgi:hypothetical protein